MVRPSAADGEIPPRSVFVSHDDKDIPEETLRSLPPPASSLLFSFLHATTTFRLAALFSVRLACAASSSILAKVVAQRPTTSVKCSRQSREQGGESPCLNIGGKTLQARGGRRTNED